MKRTTTTSGGGERRRERERAEQREKAEQRGRTVGRHHLPPDIAFTRRVQRFWVRTGSSSSRFWRFEQREEKIETRTGGLRFCPTNFRFTSVQFRHGWIRVAGSSQTSQR
ncbi:hypothetical protein Hdeb2414_s0031g00709481 [Helianthus debilis subsp. tardiflorus]